MSQTATEPNLELQTIRSSHSQEDSRSELENNTAEIEYSSLPPTDHSRQAYLVLLGCTLIQAPIWGYSLSFGVFQEFYASSPNSPLKNVSNGSVATIGTTLNGVMYLMMPITFTLLSRYPQIRRFTGLVGLAITISSLVLSSFATKVWQLILSQGIMCAIGSGLLFSPTTLYLDEWFVSRKGMAYGVMWAGKSGGGVAFPFIMSSLLARFGARTTLLAWSAALGVITAPLLFFLKPRVPLSQTTTQRPLDWGFLKTTTFWMLQAGNVAQSLGYMMPSTYLPSYAHYLGLPTITGAILVALSGLASTPGGIVIGWLADRFSPMTCVWISSFGSTLAVFLLWGLGTSFGLLVVFSLVYGFFAGAFSSTYPAMIYEMKVDNDQIDSGLIMGLLLGGRGLGYVVGGPVSSGLLMDSWNTVGNWGYNTTYGPLIVATGITALFGGWGWMWKVIRMMTA